MGSRCVRRGRCTGHDRKGQAQQRESHDAVAPDQHEQFVCAAADASLAAWPSIENDTRLAQALRANTTALAALAEESLFLPEAHIVLYRVGDSLGEAGQATAARDYFHHLTRTTTSRLNPDHSSTLAARHSFAYWQGEAGNPAGAATAFAELLVDRLRVLGPDHPHTLSTRYRLALCRGEAGDPAGAAAALAELLEDYMRVLGPDHPHTRNTLHNHAYWRGEAGDPAGE